MRHAVPPGQGLLPEEALADLAELTGELSRARPDSDAELRRYLSIQDRKIAMPTTPVVTTIRAKRILVTGGSGCLGTALLRQLVGMQPAALLSAAVTAPRQPVPGVGYEHVDVRDRDAVGACLRRFRPDIVFHLAAQRQPGLAEEQVALTVHTNVLGTRNVAEAAEDAGVRQLVYASTGKALRPYTDDVYAESKRMGEWVIGQVAARDRVACTGVRFTHVVDNSIVLRRFRDWCERGQAVRVHSADTVFYAQSAVESAQLMLVALAESVRRPEPILRLFMIRDLGWPISLLDLALGVIRESGGRAPLYLAGHDPGYEQAPYPGLYDPMLAGDVSPLINALEAHEVRGCASPAVDVVPVQPVSDRRVSRGVATLERQCAAGDEEGVRATFQEAAWDLLDATLRATSPTVLARITRITAPYRPGMNPQHVRMDEMFRRYGRPVAAETSGPVSLGISRP